MKIKKIILIIILIIVVFLFGKLIFGKKIEEVDSGKIKILTSNFACYDFIRAIIGENENIELEFLIGPGKDAHSFDPTALDIVKIQNADLFVYIGGEMENWAGKVLESIDSDRVKTVCISDLVETIKEKDVDGVEEHEHVDEEVHNEKEHHEEHEHEEGAFDEHIWTSPENAIKMVEILEEQIKQIDSNNSDYYSINAKNYITEIKQVDEKIQNIVDNRKRNRLVFADKMPMQYFMDYYNLEVSAAFDGCSTETDPSAKTIAYLENKIKEEKIPVVLYIELNPGRVANTIAQETGAKALQIQTLHNVSLEDFNNNETWVSLMTRNLEVLRQALD